MDPQVFEEPVRELTASVWRELRDAVTVIDVPAPAPDDYHWRVIYTDGSTFDEFDEPGAPHALAEVRRAEVRTLCWLPQRTDRAAVVLQVPADPACVPMFTRRRQFEVVVATGASIPRAPIHILGWTWGERAVYLFVLPDGSVLLTPDLNP